MQPVSSRPSQEREQHMRHPIRDSAGTGDQLGVAPVDENPPAATVWAGSIGPLPVTPPRSVPGPPPRLRVWASSANGRGWLLAASPLITAIFLTLLAASALALCWLELAIVAVGRRRHPGQGNCQPEKTRERQCALDVPRRAPDQSHQPDSIGLSRAPEIPPATFLQRGVTDRRTVSDAMRGSMSNTS